MSDEVREYLRAAQQAELRGDKPAAVELLQKAASLYKSRGAQERALSLLRHAQRLGGGTSVDTEVKRMDWVPERGLARAIDSAQEEAEEDRALSTLDAMDDVARVRSKLLVERGPQKADPSLQAWCSFCCKPRSEIGDLVAGPAGAFICVSCLRESSRLLGFSTATPATTSTPKPAQAPQASNQRRGGWTLVGQASAVAALDAALRRNPRGLLLVGPASCGKSTHLHSLAEAGLGRYYSLEQWERNGETMLEAEGERLLLDGLESLSGPALSRLSALLSADDGPPFLVVSRGQLAKAKVSLKSEDSKEFALFSNQELVSATNGKLSEAVAARVEAAVSFEPLSKAELETLVTQRAAERGDVELSPDALAALSECALASPTPGAEVEALVRRLPAGTWAGAAVSKRKRKKKGEPG